MDSKRLRRPAGRLALGVLAAVTLVAALTVASGSPLPDSAPPPADPLARSVADCKEERQVCVDLGPGLWVQQNSGNQQVTNTAEFDYRGGNSGFTLWYNGAKLAEVAIQSDTPYTEGVVWPQLLPPFNTPCGCCDLCRAQPNNDVRAGRWGVVASAAYQQLRRCLAPPAATAAWRCLVLPACLPGCLPLPACLLAPTYPPTAPAPVPPAPLPPCHPAPPAVQRRRQLSKVQGVELPPRRRRLPPVHQQQGEAGGGHCAGAQRQLDLGPG